MAEFKERNEPGKWHARLLRLALVLAWPVLWSVPAMADVLLIEEVRESKRQDLPKTGQLKGQVQAKLGQPNAVSGPVGDPPITRWTYDDFSVYFEYDHVITSVLNRGAVISQEGDDMNGDGSS